MSDNKVSTTDTWEYQRAPLSIDGWEEFRDQSMVPHYDSYVVATGGIVQHLENLLNTTTSFAELKEQLTKFTANRKEFVTYALQHYPS